MAEQNTLAALKIRDVRIAPATVLAPMAGVTDTVFRRMIRSLGACGLIMTEFTSAEGVTRDAPRTLHYLYFDPDEHPITAQLFGADGDVLARAAGLVEQLGFDIVDINLGCPAKKVVKCGGSGLLRDLHELERILRKVRAAVSIPLTIKIRAGWDDKSIVAVEVARLAEAVGVEAIAVHPRTRQQGYEGAADWNIIRAVKQSVGIPVIGNGDIRVPADAMRMVRETGCDAVMIGRAASTNPWIFHQIEQLLTTGRFDEPTEADRYRLLATYFRCMVDGGQPDAIGKMKQFACWFTHGVRNGAELRQQVHHSHSTQEILERVDGFFASVVSQGGAEMSETMPASVGERRAERRVRVRLPLEVHGVDRAGIKFAEHTTSEDLCRGGVAFSLVHEIEVDVELDLNIPLPRQGPRGETEFSTTGRVRHVQASGTGRVVGVQFTGPRFRHLFASESAQE